MKKKTLLGTILTLLLIGILTVAFNIQPVRCKQPLEELIETIETWNLHKGTEKSLKSKLYDVIHLLNKGNENGAIHKLTDFMNQVEAMRGKKLANEQADYLISEAQEIIDAIKG